MKSECCIHACPVAVFPFVFVLTVSAVCCVFVVLISLGDSIGGGRGHTKSIVSCLWVDVLDLLLTGSEDCDIRAWGIESEIELDKDGADAPAGFKLEGHTDKVTSMALVPAQFDFTVKDRPDGDTPHPMLISVSHDCTIRYVAHSSSFPCTVLTHLLLFLQYLGSPHCKRLFDKAGP